MNNQTEDRRAKFEAYAIREGGHLGRCVDSGDYVSDIVHGAWLGFNAALDSVVVELPHRYSDSCTEISEQSHAYNDAFDRCKEAIHAAGVKTK